MSYLLLTITIFFLEYYIKQHMDKIRTSKQQRPLASGKIVLKKYHNTGAAGNFLQSHPKWVKNLHLSALLTVFAAFICIRRQKGAGMAKTGIALLAGGGLSNLYDRLTKGYVVDYVSFGFGPKWFRRLVFNLADFFVFLGIGLCMIQVLWKNK